MQKNFDEESSWKAVTAKTRKGMDLMRNIL
jgi:hypothetical protein